MLPLLAMDPITHTADHSKRHHRESKNKEHKKSSKKKKEKKKRKHKKSTGEKRQRRRSSSSNSSSDSSSREGANSQKKQLTERISLHGSREDGGDRAKEGAEEPKLQRPQWMLNEPADFFRLTEKVKKPVSVASLPQISSRELNPELRRQLSSSSHSTDPSYIDSTRSNDPSYIDSTRSSPPQSSASSPRHVGVGGLQWKANKVQRVYDISKQTHRAVEDVAVERFGSLDAWDAARNQVQHLLHPIATPTTPSSAQKKTSGSGLFLRPGQSTSRSTSTRSVVDDKKELSVYEKEREAALFAPVSHDTAESMEQADKWHLPTEPNLIKPTNQTPAEPHSPSSLKQFNATTLPSQEKQTLQKDGKSSKEETVFLLPLDERGRYMDIGIVDDSTKYEQYSKINKRRKNPSESDDGQNMDIQTMIRLEKMQSTSSMAEEYSRRIMKDGRFESNLEYMDANSGRLSHTQQLSNSQKRQLAISSHTKIQSIMEKCPFCFTDDRVPSVPIVATGTRVYLALPKTLSLVPGHCLIVPMQHNVSTLDCDDAEWDEIRNFMKCILRMFHAQDHGVVFMETAIEFRKSWHIAIDCVPVPYTQYDQVPAYFKQSILQAADEWAQNRKLIDTSQKGFRRSLVPNIPYFHVWFGLDKGYGHVIENESRFPYWFGKEVLGGMMDIAPDRWRRPKSLSDEERDRLMDEFKRQYTPFDWTPMLYAE